MFSKAVGAVVGIKLCSCLGVSNFGAVQIGIIFLMGSLIMIGFSRTTLEMFLGEVKFVLRLVNLISLLLAEKFFIS